MSLTRGRTIEAIKMVISVNVFRVRVAVTMDGRQWPTNCSGYCDRIYTSPGNKWHCTSGIIVTT